MTKQEFTIKNLIALSELFDKKLSESLIEIYWMALKDFEMDDLQKGFNRAMRECKFFPKPVEIADFIGCSSTDRALIAFGKLCDAIADHGHNYSIAFDDPVIHSVIREMGGWQKCCSWETNELPFRQKEFERWYLVYRNSERPHPVYIAGLSETQNRKYIGHPIHDKSAKESMRIKFIGDTEKAKYIMEKAQEQSLLRSNAQALITTQIEENDAK